MPDLTDEEYEALEAQVMRNPPKVSGDGTGGFITRHQTDTLVFLDHVSATWAGTIRSHPQVSDRNHRRTGAGKNCRLRIGERHESS